MVALVLVRSSMSLNLLCILCSASLTFLRKMMWLLLSLILRVVSLVRSRVLCTVFGSVICLRLAMVVSMSTFQKVCTNDMYLYCLI